MNDPYNAEFSSSRKLETKLFQNGVSKSSSKQSEGNAYTDMTSPVNTPNRSDQAESNDLHINNGDPTCEPIDQLKPTEEAILAILDLDLDHHSLLPFYRELMANQDCIFKMDKTDKQVFFKRIWLYNIQEILKRTKYEEFVQELNKLNINDDSISLFGDLWKYDPISIIKDIKQKSFEDKQMLAKSIRESFESTLTYQKTIQEVMQATSMNINLYDLDKKEKYEVRYDEKSILYTIIYSDKYIGFAFYENQIKSFQSKPWRQIIARVHEQFVNIEKSAQESLPKQFQKSLIKIKHGQSLVFGELGQVAELLINYPQLQDSLYQEQITLNTVFSKLNVTLDEVSYKLNYNVVVKQEANKYQHEYNPMTKSSFVQIDRQVQQFSDNLLPGVGNSNWQEINQVINYQNQDKQEEEKVHQNQTQENTQSQTSVASKYAEPIIHQVISQVEEQPPNQNSQKTPPKEVCFKYIIKEVNIEDLESSSIDFDALKKDKKLLFKERSDLVPSYCFPPKKCTQQGCTYDGSPTFQFWCHETEYVCVNCILKQLQTGANSINCQKCQQPNKIDSCKHYLFDTEQETFIKNAIEKKYFVGEEQSQVDQKQAMPATCKCQPFEFVKINCPNNKNVLYCFDCFTKEIKSFTRNLPYINSYSCPIKDDCNQFLPLALLELVLSKENICMVIAYYCEQNMGKYIQTKKWFDDIITFYGSSVLDRYLLSQRLMTTVNTIDYYEFQDMIVPGQKSCKFICCPNCYKLALIENVPTFDVCMANRCLECETTYCIECLAGSKHIIDKQTSAWHREGCRFHAKSNEECDCEEHHPKPNSLVNGMIPFAEFAWKFPEVV